VDETEIKYKLSEYRSLQEFFNRDIDLEKRGDLAFCNRNWRVPDADPNAVYAPADSKLTQHGFFSQQQKALVKGA